MCQSLFLIKVASVRPATLLKKSFWHRYFPVNFVKFLRTPIQFRKTNSFLLIKMSCLSCLVLICFHCFFLKWWNYIKTLTSQTSQKYSTSIVVLRRILLWIFGKCISINKHSHGYSCRQKKVKSGEISYFECTSQNLGDFRTGLCCLMYFLTSETK